MPGPRATERVMWGLYGVKPWFVRRLRRVEDALVRRRVSPDTLSWAAVALSLAAGVALAVGGLIGAPIVWLLVPPLGFGRLALNALDGAVARRTGTARPAGAALNEATDRISDAALLAGAGLATDPVLGLGALVCSFGAGAAGVVSWALTGRRDRSGPMGKADRVAVVSAAAAVGVLTASADPLAWALWTVIAGAIATTALRAARLRAALLAAHPAVNTGPVTVDLEPAPDIADEELCGALVR